MLQSFSFFPDKKNIQLEVMSEVTGAILILLPPSVIAATCQVDVLMDILFLVFEELPLVAVTRKHFCDCG